MGLIVSQSSYCSVCYVAGALVIPPSKPPPKLSSRLGILDIWFALRTIPSSIIQSGFLALVSTLTQNPVQSSVAIDLPFVFPDLPCYLSYDYFGPLFLFCHYPN